MPGAILPLLSLLITVDVRAPGRCPASGDVLRRLEPILPSATAGLVGTTTGDIATLEEAVDGTLSLTLSHADGALVGRRNLPRSPSCAEQAETVAVTLAVWESQLHPEITLRLDRLPEGSAETVGVAPPTPHPAPPLRVDVGVAFGLATAATNPTPAGVARFDLALALPDDAWRVRLSASGVGEQTIDVPPGRATWRRLSGALAVDRVLSHFSERRGAWLLGVGPSLGYLSVRGEGYTVNHHAVLADVGAELGTRLERASGRWRGWWGVAATWWMRPQQLEVSGVGGTVSERALPRIEVAMVLGVAMSFLPFEK